MSRESLLILIGILVMLSPFVGIPLAYLAWILPVLGLIVLGIAYSLRARRKHVAPPPSHEMVTSAV